MLEQVCLFAFAQMSINEIMQSNVDCIIDDLNEFPDSWVELFNAGATSENLNNYKIGLTDNADEAWQLPDSLVKVGGAVLIYCDKSKDEKPSLHTNFSLESGKGGSIFLFKNGEITDKLENIKKQPAPNIAYGRLNESSTTWGYQYIPTPNSINCGIICNQILDDPIFNISGKILENIEPCILELTMPEGSPAGTEIRYSLDGSEPTQKSYLYSDAIRIDSNTVVRAKLFCKGYLSPRSVTHSYLFHGREITLPVISLVTDSSYLYDDKIGIYVKGDFEKDKNNYNFNWRRPVNIEYYDYSREFWNPINQLCEARIMGGASRDWNLKSMAFYANKRFGTKRFNCDFFPSQKPNLKEFKSFILRNGGNDYKYLHMRDAIIQQSVGKYVDLDWQAYQPVIFYINGQYKGILNLRERSNEDYVWSNYDGLENIDLIENLIDLKEGDWDNYNEFQSFYSKRGNTFSEYEKWMDLEEYTNLMIMNIFYNNMDFPGNNIVMWRSKIDNGRWRFIAKDTDMGLGLYWWPSPSGYKTFEWLYNPDYDSIRNNVNREEHTRLFRHLMEDDDYRNYFIDRACIYLGDFLSENTINRLIDNMYDQIKIENPYHIKANAIPIDYLTELSDTRQWVHERIDSFYSHMGEFYKVGEPIHIQINKGRTDVSDSQLIFNGVTLTDGVFDGKFYPERNISLKGKVSGWTVRYVYSSKEDTSYYNGSSCNFMIPTSCISVTVESDNQSSIINNLGVDSISLEKINDGVVIKGITEGTPVLLFDISGKLISSKYSGYTQCELIIPSSGLFLIKVGCNIFKYLQ